MNTSSAQPQDVAVGVIGDGFGALLVYTSAIYLGFRPEQIGIFGENENPVQTYQQFAWNLGQTVLRSESESHFLPADWPTFAQVDASARRDLSPLLRSVGRKFNPGVPEMLSEAAVSRTGWAFRERVIGGRKVGWLVREPGPPAHFSLYDEDAQLLGRCKHAMIAIGHGRSLSRGPTARRARIPRPRRPHRPGLRAQAVLPRRPLPRLGSGIASVNEWANAIDAGAQCIALRRNPHPEEQDLNVPRCLFDGSGIDAFQGLSFDERRGLPWTGAEGTVAAAP